MVVVAVVVVLVVVVAAAVAAVVLTNRVTQIRNVESSLKSPYPPRC